MSGVDLSRFLSGGTPRARPFAWGGYKDNHYVRTDSWAYMADNRMRKSLLFDLEKDPGEGTNVAERHPRVLEGLRETLIQRAGGRPPFYGV
jgi:arylsulfatase A-like enzyme